MKRVAAALVAGAALLVVASCSTSGGQPVVSSSASAGAPSASAGSADLPNSGAPAVSNPLPESVLSGDPCEALTGQQVQEALGTDSAGERRDLDQTGPRCDWRRSAPGGGGFAVNFNTKTRLGLSGTYANAKPQSAVFREAGPVEGFPAAEYKPDVEGIDCTVVVGLADEYTVSVTGTLSSQKEGTVDPCEPTEKVATLVVGNLKQAAGE